MSAGNNNDLYVPTNMQSFLLADKMSCVRWVPNLTEDEHFFVTGSWGDRVNAVNLWTLVHDELTDGESGIPLVPKRTAKFCVASDVVGLGFIDDTNLVSVTAEGTLSVLDLNRESAMSYDFTHKFNMHDLHKVDGRQSFCSVMRVSPYDQCVITGGEDGNVNIISTDVGTVLNTIEFADKSSISCLSYIFPNIVVVGRHCDMITIFDTRQSCTKSLYNVDLHQEHSEMNIPTCLNYLPRQNMLILAGTENGSMINWDLRDTSSILYEYGDHSDPVTDIQFAEQHDKMFSADAGGKVNEWSIENLRELVGYYMDKKQVLMKDFKAINSIDVNARQMICCGDAEMVFIADI